MAWALQNLSKDRKNRRVGRLEEEDWEDEEEMGVQDEEIVKLLQDPELVGKMKGECSRSKKKKMFMFMNQSRSRRKCSKGQGTNCRRYLKVIRDYYFDEESRFS
jgi:hypothetical protein